MTFVRARCFAPSAFVCVALLIGTVVPIVASGEPVAATTTPGEFAAITTNCFGIARTAGSLAPLIHASLYNLPSGASPTVSATITTGTTTSPLTLLISPFSPSPPPGAYYWASAMTFPALRGQLVSISLTWSDGVGGSGALGPQVVGLPTCTPVSRRAAAMAANQGGTGYWTVTQDGIVHGFGQGLSYGDMGYLPLNAPMVGLAPTMDGEGYWLLGADGGVFSFGTARFYGSTGNLRLNAPVVAMATTPDGGGYWFVASDGGVSSYGDAHFYGSMGGQHLNAPIVGMAVDQVTGGYWLVASDGGIFSFNAPFRGSAGSLTLHSPIVGMEAASDASGYRLAAGDGGVFAYNLPFAGAYVGLDTMPIVGIAGQGDTGYWLADACGGVAAFGSAQTYGPS